MSIEGGESEVKSYPGMCLTILIFLTTVLYAQYKTETMISKSDRNFTSQIIKTFYNDSFVFSYD